MKLYDYRTPFMHDRDLDRLLCDVDPPAGLTERLRALPERMNAEYQDDEQRLKMVPVPAGLSWRLSQITKSGTRERRRLLLALATAAMITLVLWPLLAGLARRQVAIAPRAVPLDPMPVDLLPDDSLPLDPLTVDRSGPMAEVPELKNGLDAQGFEDASQLTSLAAWTDGVMGGRDAASNAIQSEPLLAWESSDLAGHVLTPDEVVSLESWARTAGAYPWPNDPQSLMRIGRRFPIVMHTAVDVSGATQDARFVVASRPSGVPLPDVPEYPRAWFEATGVHPFVRPEAHVALQHSRVPLEVDRWRLELVRESLDSRRLPAPSLVRVEDLLSLIDEEGPRPERQPLAVSVRAGRSPFSNGQLLSLECLTSQRSPAKHEPTELILALDVSAEMAEGGRWRRVCRAVESFVAALGSDDRLTIVLFNQQLARMEEVHSAAERQRVASWLRAFEPTGTTHIGVGLRAALERAEAGPFVDDGDTANASRPNRKLVLLISDGGTPLEESSARAMERALGQYAGLGIGLSVLDVSGTERGDVQLARFAKAARGTIRRCWTTEQVSGHLSEALSGLSPIVARDASLEVRFDPSAVAAWRLVGHEMGREAGARPLSGGEELLAGQRTAALFELHLRPTAGDLVGEILLRWIDPQSGSAQESRRPLHLADFTASASRDYRLETIALAVHTAESLRMSPFASRTPWSELIAAVRFWPKAWKERADVVELLKLAELARELSTDGPGPRRP